MTDSLRPAADSSSGANLARRLVVFLDGTWNHPDQQDRGMTKPSNVTKLARAVKQIAVDGRFQVTYYDDGVGTSWGLDKLAGGGLGVGLAKNVREAYRFLAYNYREGDEIYVFGFSRGAWTARSLAGFIERAGMLPKSGMYYMLQAFALYEKRCPRADFDDLFASKDVQTRRVRIDFIGVWDTVGAIGLPSRFFHAITRNRWNYHDVSLVPAIRHARHALAIDEKRRPFRPTLWTDRVRENQTLEQRWFPGVHSNIGGGYAKDGLANHALRWIAEEARAVGLDLDQSFLEPYRPFWAHEMRESYRGFYWLLGRAVRAIGLTENGSETLDASAYYRWCNPDNVLQREGQKAPWRPRNLAAYFDVHGINPCDQLAAMRDKREAGASASAGGGRRGSP